MVPRYLIALGATLALFGASVKATPTLHAREIKTDDYFGCDKVAVDAQIAFKSVAFCDALGYNDCTCVNGRPECASEAARRCFQACECRTGESIKNPPANYTKPELPQFPSNISVTCGDKATEFMKDFMGSREACNRTLINTCNCYNGTVYCADAGANTCFSDCACTAVDVTPKVTASTKRSVYLPRKRSSSEKVARQADGQYQLSCSTGLEACGDAACQCTLTGTLTCASKPSLTVDVAKCRKECECFPPDTESIFSPGPYINSTGDDGFGLLPTLNVSSSKLNITVGASNATCSNAFCSYDVPCASGCSCNYTYFYDDFENNIANASGTCTGRQQLFINGRPVDLNNTNTTQLKQDLLDIGTVILDGGLKQLGGLGLGDLSGEVTGPDVPSPTKAAIPSSSMAGGIKARATGMA